MRKFLYACVLACLLAVTTFAGPPEMPGYEGQQVTDSDGIVWVWLSEAWRMIQ
jgi:hypothetical protein